MAPARATTRRTSDPGLTRALRSCSPAESGRSVLALAARHGSFGDAKNSSAKYSLATQINRLLDEQRLSQNAAAERLGVPQSKVSAIRNYKLHGISLERLLQALVALDQNVAIVVTPRGAPLTDSISVAI